MARRPAYLRKLHITRVDRVAEPANPESVVSLFKSKEATVPTTPDPKMVAAAKAKAAQLRKELNMPEPINRDELDADVLALITELETKLAEATAAGTPTATEPTAPSLDTATEAELADAVEKRFGKTLIAKAAEEPTPAELPDPVRKRLEEVETINKAYADRIVQLETIAKTAEFTAVAEEFSNLGGAAELAPVLMDAADNMSADNYKALTSYLKSANALAGESHDLITKERGVAASGDPGVGNEIEQLAKAARTADPTLSESQARTQVLSQRPELYARFTESKNR